MTLSVLNDFCGCCECCSREQDDCTLGHEYPSNCPDMRAPCAAVGWQSARLPVIQGRTGVIVLSIRIDNGVLLAGKVRVVTTFWQRHRPFNRPCLGADQGLLLSPGSSVHSFGMPCLVDVVFLGPSWQVLATRACLPRARWLRAPSDTRAALLLAAGRCALVGLERGMTLCQDTAARAALPFATTLIRRDTDVASS